jgi:hypothetical protein
MDNVQKASKCISLLTEELPTYEDRQFSMESILGPLGTSATSGLLYLSRVIVRMENLVVRIFAKGNRSNRRKPARAPLCPPQIPLDQTRARTRTAAVGIKQLAA